MVLGMKFRISPMALCFLPYFLPLASAQGCVYSNELSFCRDVIDYPFPVGFDVAGAQRKAQYALSGAWDYFGCPLLASRVFECGKNLPRCVQHGNTTRVLRLCSSDCQTIKNLCPSTHNHFHSMDCFDDEVFAAKPNCFSLEIKSPCSFGRTILREVLELVAIIFCLGVGRKLMNRWRRRHLKSAPHANSEFAMQQPTNDRAFLLGSDSVASAAAAAMAENGAENEEPNVDSATVVSTRSIDRPSEAEQEAPECRICRLDEEEGPMLSPCLCKGSIALVHAKCLQQWMESRGGEVAASVTCEVCHQRYRISVSRHVTCSLAKACSRASWGEYFSAATLAVTAPFLPVMNWMLCANQAQTDVRPMSAGDSLFVIGVEVVMLLGFTLAFHKTYERWAAVNSSLGIAPLAEGQPVPDLDDPV